MQKLKSLKGLLITCMILFCAATFANQPEAVDMDGGDGYKKGKMTKDKNGVDVFVCPHSSGDTNCV